MSLRGLALGLVLGAIAWAGIFWSIVAVTRPLDGPLEALREGREREAASTERVLKAIDDLERAWVAAEARR